MLIGAGASWVAYSLSPDSGPASDMGDSRRS